MGMQSGATLRVVRSNDVRMFKLRYRCRAVAHDFFRPSLALSTKGHCPISTWAEPVAHKTMAISRVPLALPVLKHHLFGEASLGTEFSSFAVPMRVEGQRNANCYFGRAASL